MSTLETLLWGAAGAFLGLLAVGILPVLAAKAEGKSARVKFWWLIIDIVAYVFGGGLFAVVIGDATAPKHAAFYGIGWDSGVKVIIGEGGRALGRAIETGRFRGKP